MVDFVAVMDPADPCRVVIYEGEAFQAFRHPNPRDHHCLKQSLNETVEDWEDVSRTMRQCGYEPEVLTVNLALAVAIRAFKHSMRRVT